jgi:hypothetical protein
LGAARSEIEGEGVVERTAGGANIRITFIIMRLGAQTWADVIIYLNVSYI